MKTLYRKEFEHDSCGIGAVVSIHGVRTHQTVSDALEIVEHLEHRAGKDADGKTGDGVGILTQIPHAFFRRVCRDFTLQGDEFGIGMFFFPNQDLQIRKAKKMLEVIALRNGCRVLGWREVPVHKDILGKKALDSCPAIWQCFLEKPEQVPYGMEFDRRLYFIHRAFEASNSDTYVCSLSCRTIVYKGMLLVKQLRQFFDDLSSEDYVSAIALVHSRFSTNTMPSWKRAHPNRLIMHNGEINTIKGNAGSMRAREEVLTSSVFKDQLEQIYPIVDASGSDSAMLDNALEFLTMNGMPLPKAVMKLIPEPWNQNPNMSESLKDFYEYSAETMEPWDGPASIIFSDGELMGAVLDRNGLRPSRYYITEDGYLILSSEVGVLPVDQKRIVQKDRLRPGKMLLVDTREGRLIQDAEIKRKYAEEYPYGEWLNSNLICLKDLPVPNHRTPSFTGDECRRLEKIYGYSYEEYRDYILPMALTGIEPTVSMGKDTPLACLSRSPRPLFDYFQQVFAQVTNPPIDSIREESVTSTCVFLGRDGNLLKDCPENARMLKINNPILSNLDLMKIREMHAEGFQTAVISCLYHKNTSLHKALQDLFNAADRALKSGADILILSDRGISETDVPIPSLLAVSALHQHLLKTKKRMSCSLILESAEPRQVHHFAVLLGYGADAVNGYLIQDCIEQMIQDRMLDKDCYAAVRDYNLGILKGIVKIAGKMGISTIQSYQGSQNFEALGISKEVIEEYFGQTVSRIGGISLKDIEEEMDQMHSSVYDPLGRPVDLSLDSRGEHKYRSHMQDHLYSPETICLLQRAIRENRYDLYQKYSESVRGKTPYHLRDLLEFVPGTPVPIESVESVDDIVRRFKTGAMSYGAISKEAHETMAVAMNRLHASSNSGEGGEDEDRWQENPGQNNRNSAIKQVASGRFGVDLNYLNHAREIQIKMAQGAKPGEGGQLPGRKVYPWIAKCRHSTPGVQLISPPPHHDIYSIEDLAQLIYDLKCASENARINVKLVSQAGVGTVAAGVAKAGAQVILISGFDGGTGAAMLNSVYHAGLPLELGIAEAHQTLLMNGLRNRVTLEADGKLMNGHDAAVACLLGAEEFGFATAVLVSMGCVMMRACSLDSCPVGIATQNPELRKRFKGTPEDVIRFMQFTAREMREIMASLGFHSIDEMVGHADCLKQTQEIGKIDLSEMLAYVNPDQGFASNKDLFDFHLDRSRERLLLEPEFKACMQKDIPYSAELAVSNTDRTFGTLLGADLIRMHPHGMKEGSCALECRGSGGQSFGAFLPAGMRIRLNGDCNDYLGKGLSGGTLIIQTPKDFPHPAEDNIICGNVALYGATAGYAYINGCAGERFCVRNSGAEAVAEGTGDHALEYMTGGTVMILGRVGKNFAAGMSGGIAYVYDENNTLYRMLNSRGLTMSHVTEKHDRTKIREMLEEHIRWTGSLKAEELLEHFEDSLTHFKKIIPNDYAVMICLIAENEEKGMTQEEAQLEAFSRFVKGERQYGKA